MRRTSRSPAGRGGFTLVELLVAAALALVVMTVLSLAFQAAMQTLSQLKSVVGMAEQLRTAEGVLRADLAAQHLEAEDGSPVKLSVGGTYTKGYLTFTQGGMVSTAGATAAGQSGRGIAPYAESKGQGENGVPSYRTQAADTVQVQTGSLGSLADNPDKVDKLFGRAWMDYLAMTVKLDGGRPQDVFTAPAEGLLPTLVQIDKTNGGLTAETRAADPTSKQLTSRWAEVAYFLKPASAGGSTTPTVFSSDEQGVLQLPLYTLYRRQRVLVERSMGGTGPMALTPQQAEDHRQVATATNGGTVRVLGPEAVSGVAAGATDWTYVQPNGSVVRSRIQQDTTPTGLNSAANRLGGTNDLLANPTHGLPDVSGLTPLLKGDLQRRPYPIPEQTTLAAGGKPCPDYGADVLVTNVVSMTIRPVFEFDVSPTVRAAVANATVGKTFYPVPKMLARPADQSEQTAPADWLELYDFTTGPPAAGTPPGFPRSYDTAGPSKVGVVFREKGTNTLIPVSGGWETTNPTLSEVTVRLKALEIKLRVYDAKNQNTRQMTVLQDL